MTMFKHIVFRIIAGLILLAAIAGLGFFAYQAGVAHGIATNIQVPGADVPGAGSLLYGMPYRHFMGFPGFGLFGVLFAFFLLFLAFGAMRRLIWGPRWGWRHMGHGPMGYGRMGHGPWGEGGVPPMFAEMHRRAHAAEANEDAAGKKPE
jgi:hypothetical protein